MPDEVPGRAYFLEFVAKHGAMSRTRFLTHFTRPAFLLTSESFARATGGVTTESEVPLDMVFLTPSPLPFFVYDVAKREGATATRAVTIGRALSNDIVITDPGISRIHAALFPQKDGK